MSPEPQAYDARSALTKRELEDEIAQDQGKERKCFRIMDLPAELRDMICYFAVLDYGEVRWSLDRSLCKRQLHPLTCTSRQLRYETLALAWSQVKLRVDEFDSMRLLEESPCKFESTIRNFLDPSGRGCENVRYLRFASLYLRLRRRDVRAVHPLPHATFQLRMSYLPWKGVEMEPLPNRFQALTPCSADRLQEYIAAVSRKSQALDLGGGALVEVIARFPELWASEKLLCEQSE